MQQWQYLLQWVLPGWLLLHVKRVRHRVLQVRRFEWEVPNLRNQSLPRRRRQVLVEEQPTRRCFMLGQQLVCRRFLRRWALLRVSRVRFRMFCVRLFEWEVSDLPIEPLP